MPSSEPVNWQPMSQMPLVAGLIDGALRNTRDHLHTLTKARAKPHVLDDATVDRIERVHREQLEFVDIYAEQIGFWGAVERKRHLSLERRFGCRESVDRHAMQAERLRNFARCFAFSEQAQRKSTLLRVEVPGTPKTHAWA
jgi:hypothetical protein